MSRESFDRKDDKSDDIIIEARDVFYTYEEGGPHSLNGVSLKIKRGQKVAFMGANGCGKSTFFLCCNGIYKPEKGCCFSMENRSTIRRRGF